MVYNENNMIKRKIMLAAALLAAMLISCKNPGQGSSDGFDSLKENEFYAQNMETGKYYKVKANKMYDNGKNCVIWTEEGSGITPERAKEIADEYNAKIRPRVVNTFSKKNFDFQEENKIYHFNDMLDFANALAGRNDKKLTILLLDIKDGFKNENTDSYVAGYFFGGNLYPKGKISGTAHYSNGRDMIYVDTNPGLKTKPQQTYATFAHELQHLISFATTVQMGREDLMDTWVDEGLSSQAEYLYFGDNPPDKSRWFMEDVKGTIAKGNNFFVWDNHREEPLAILDDYATVYLFFRWLYLQAEQKGLQSDIFLKIETSAFTNYTAVANVAQQINSAWGSWETLLRTWLAANYYPKNVDYGYKNDSELQKIKVKPIAGQKISLYPGEGVYSIDNSSLPSAGGSNIHYAGLAANTINVSPPYTGDVLLTFNANTDNTAKGETIVLTSVSPPVPRMAAGSIQTGTSAGPYVIDARDMLNKNKK